MSLRGNGFAGGGHHGGGHHGGHGGGHHGGSWGGGYYPWYAGGYSYPETSILYDIVQATLPCYVKTTGGYNTYQVATTSECTAMGGTVTLPALKGFGATEEASPVPGWVLAAGLIGLGMIFLATKKR